MLIRLTNQAHNFPQSSKLSVPGKFSLAKYWVETDNMFCWMGCEKEAKIRTGYMCVNEIPEKENI